MAWCKVTFQCHVLFTCCLAGFACPLWSQQLGHGHIGHLQLTLVLPKERLVNPHCIGLQRAMLMPCEAGFLAGKASSISLLSSPNVPGTSSAVAINSALQV